MFTLPHTQTFLMCVLVHVLKQARVICVTLKQFASSPKQTKVICSLETARIISGHHMITRAATISRSTSSRTPNTRTWQQEPSLADWLNSSPFTLVQSQLQAFRVELNVAHPHVDLMPWDLRRRAAALLAAPSHSFQIAQPFFTFTDLRRDGSIRKLSRIDRVFANLPMAELRDFQCHPTRLGQSNQCPAITFLSGSPSSALAGSNRTALCHLAMVHATSLVHQCFD